ncbi:DDE superfamily endonuclease [Ceratobasidium sp. AG-Ba]|nr:DDE superfamily endonuclease [Ceratobasidium sp. AG-Ba]
MVKRYNIPPEHQWGMDEKGIEGGGSRSSTPQKHFFGLLEKLCYKLKSDSLELTTAIECLNAKGAAMKPSFVHQKGDVGKWWEDDHIGDNGWVSDDICKQWFKKVFIPEANNYRVSDAPIVLLVDGHGSHISTSIRQIGFKKRIFIFCHPPKTTHKTQPLDVGVFNRVQAEWKKICERSAGVESSVSKATTIENYMATRQAGMQPDIIIDAWRRTGHYPCNTDIFTDMDYAPSKITSTITHLPPS